LLPAIPTRTGTRAERRCPRPPRKVRWPIMSRDEKETAVAEDGTTRGRPRLWSDSGARKRAHQKRQREKLRLVDDLLHAVRNAQWDEPELNRRSQGGDDA